MLHKKIIFFILLINQLYGLNVQEGAIRKEQQELLSIKDELNKFYETKELEYQKNKIELENIHKAIKVSELNIQKLKDQNKKILQEIKGELTNKAIRMYDKMKPKMVANIFTQMVNNGKIDQVFDIIIRMKEKNVIKLMKKLDIQTSALVMEKMKILNEQKNKKGK